MTNELTESLKHINKLIREIESGEMETELLVASSRDFVEGYYVALLEHKKSLEGLIVNYCE